MGKNTAKKFALGTLIAALVGYIAGILTAPKSGKETRQDIKNKAEDTYAAAEKELKRLHTELGQLLDQASQKADSLKGKVGKEFGEAVEKSKRAKQKTRELLSGLHEGDAEDKDLQKAISEASKAIDHLRKFLKK